jgi:hypothetical protein
MNNNVNPLAFPSHYTDPKQKVQPPFMLQFAKAAYNNWQIGMPIGSMFLARADEYQEERDYAMGRQSIDKHKRELLPEDENDESYTKISWEPRMDGVNLLNIAVAKVQKAGYNILATPINMNAKDAQDEEYAKAKVKIMMRDAIQQQAPQLANHPSLKRLPGEAADLDELQMEIDFNPKFIRAKDIEESVQLVFSENEIDKLWDEISKDLVYHGAGIAMDDLDENNKVVLRKVDISRFGCSKFGKPDGSDMTWAFIINSTKISDLSKYFDEKEITKLVNQVQGRNGNPNTLGPNSLEFNGYDIYKADVMELHFISWDKRVTETNTDKNGNIKVSKAKPSSEDKVKADTTFTAKTVENRYMCKWVVGTDLIYNYQKAPNQPRTVNIATMSKTNLPFHIATANFHNMRSRGMVAGMKSIMDDLNSSTYKLRMFRNRMVPNGFDIDLSAIEEVALGAKGKDAMSPREVINMFFETGVLISRRSGISMDANVNYKAINAISNGMADQLIYLAKDIQDSKAALNGITGLNELTDGSTPNPKTLVPVANMASESTDNALYLYVNARRNIVKDTAIATVKRLQVALKRGPYDGFNQKAGRWISVPKSIIDYDYDIVIEDQATDDQKQWLLTLVQEDIKNGFLTTADVVTIINTYNIKDAQIILNYRATKEKDKQAAQSLANTNATAQAQMQSNQAAEMLKDQMADKQMARQIRIDNNVWSWQYEIAKVKALQADAAVDKKAVTDILTSGILPSQQNPMQQPGQQQPQGSPPQGGPQQDPTQQQDPSQPMPPGS